MLTRRAAAEILVRDQHLGVAIGGLVEHELGPFGTRRVIAQGVEQVDAEAGALDGLEEAGRDDLVGVNVGERQRGRDAGQGGERPASRNLPDVGRAGR